MINKWVDFIIFTNLDGTKKVNVMFPWAWTVLYASQCFPQSFPLQAVWSIYYIWDIQILWYKQLES